MAEGYTVALQEVAGLNPVMPGKAEIIEGVL
jgi:hypothetical protein